LHQHIAFHAQLLCMSLYQTLAEQLKKHTSGEVRFDDMMRVLYSTDASHYQVYPIGVVLPKTNEDIQITVQLCAEHGVLVIPRGGGSGLCGQAIGPGVVIDPTKYMTRVLNVDTSGHSARVQAGAVLGLVNKQLAQHGLQFGPDPASAERATIGGIIGTNATGAHSIRYGMTSDNVTAVGCVLASGKRLEIGDWRLGMESVPISNLQSLISTIVQHSERAIRTHFPKVWRRASGYNLDYIAEMLAYDAANPTTCLTEANARRKTQNLQNHLRQISQFNLTPLIVGSEGTLAVVCEATLHLVPKPKRTALVVCAFANVLQAMRAVPTLLQTDPDAIELIGDTFIKLAADLPEYKDKLHWVDLAHMPEAVLVLEFAGDSQLPIANCLHRATSLIETEKLPCTVMTLTEPKAQADVWAVRKGGLAILQSIRSEFKPISVVEDIAVPVEHLADFTQGLLDIFAEFGASGALYGHASAGCLHVRPLVNLKTVDGLAKVQGIGKRALELTLQFGGALSGEHGDGYERTRHNEALFGREVFQAFCEVKEAFDPKHLLNPNKKVHGLDLDDAMRFGPGYKTFAFPSTFTFQKDGSLAALAERCNGAGVCRKQDSGVMCPSYRATLDETHNTRGRANLLQELLSNRGGKEIGDWRLKIDLTQSPVSNLQSPNVTPNNVLTSLDLCLSCKACASECASGVDMAKMKSDFTQQIYEERGVPLRAWLLGRIALLSEYASLVPDIGNWLLARRSLKRVLRIAPEHTLPKFAKQTFMSRLEIRDWQNQSPISNLLISNPQSPLQRVVLFADTFTRYNHPEIGIAAVEVLEHSGYEVVIPEWQCCGRSLISQGQPKAARELAEFNIRTLAPYARQGLPIVGLEPSCISALKDDYLDLIPSEDAKAVAKQTMSIEEFLISNFRFQIDELRDQSKIQNLKSKILFHGHCHQKALWGTQASKAVLMRAGYEVKEIESTCCGMAGAFGYEAEHAALSKQIGELALLPAVRAAPKEALIVAPGTSCRSQIEELTGRKAWHPIEILAKTL
jgi:FAD/FMN-containing dehydrogenase/Fe-S oxidoreductase